MVSYLWDPETYSENARYVSDLTSDVIELLAPQSTERVLDLGCGEGALTKRLADYGCRVVGVDSSPEMIAAARLRGLDVRLMSGEQLSFAREFDAVFSNQALHWMKRPDPVIAGVWRALRPGGRFVAECGGTGCVSTIIAALCDVLAQRGIDGAHLIPWYFPSPDAYAEHLRARGFRIDFIALIRRPTPLPGDIRGWLDTFAGSFTKALPPSDRDVFMEQVRELLHPTLCDPAGCWIADYVLLRFAATKTDG